METEWEDLARASYDRVADPYAELTRGAVEGDAFMAGTYATLAWACRIDAPGRRAVVADVGCGPGWWARYMGSLRVDVVGVDLSLGMVELARTRAAGEGGAVRGRLGAGPAARGRVGRRGDLHVRAAPPAR